MKTIAIHYVVLQALPAEKKVQAIKIVREITDADLRSAKNFCEALPGRFAVQSRSAAEDARAKLEALGATVELITHDQDCWPERADVAEPGSLEDLDRLTGYTDDTGPRLLALLASMRPMVDSVADYDDYRSGRSAIERLASSAEGTDKPKLQLPVCEVADVLNYLSRSIPIKTLTSDWWKEPEDAPSHVAGFSLLMIALENSLWSAGCRAPDSSAAQADVLRRLLFRLEVATWKLDMAVEHWGVPRDILEGDQGAVINVREAAAATSEVYCELSEWVHTHVDRDPLPYSWDDLQPQADEVQR